MLCSETENDGREPEKCPGVGSQGLLRPLRTQDLRAKSYLLGSIGHKNSLVGNDELSRYFPNGSVTVYLLTWNMSGKSAVGDLSELLLPESVSHASDIYAIGVQEAVGYTSQDVRDWEVALQETLGSNFVLLHSSALGVLHMSIFVRRDLIWFVSSPEDAKYGSRQGVANIVRTKGAVGISFNLFGTSLLFINCHFPAHENRNKQRVDEYEKICTSLALPKKCKSRPGHKTLTNQNSLSGSEDVTSRFDCVFWFGDLNFRIESKYNDIINTLQLATLTTVPAFELLLPKDQLLKGIEKGEIFTGFKEAARIRFPPTYKYVIGTDNYDIFSQRVPSYTDRILYRAKKEDSVTCLHYNYIENIRSSDHKPVYAVMDVQLRPGRDSSSLNVGAFNREVYLEALKRKSKV